MNDERPQNGTEDTGAAPGARSGIDDDRLLAFALGLEDDPELEAELAASPAVQRRLHQMREDLEAVERGVHAAVPDEPEHWADLSAERWADLSPYLKLKEHGAADRRHRGVLAALGSRWRTVVPAAAAVLIVALGIGVVMSRGGFSSFSSSSGSTSAETATSRNAAPQMTAPSDDFGSGGKATGGVAPVRIAGAGAYAVAAVAKAGAVHDGRQKFVTLLSIKGNAPQRFDLRVEVDGAITPGRLVAVFLEPDDPSSPCPTPVLEGRTGSPQPAPSASESALGQTSSSPLFLYKGACAAVVLLPAGTNPQDVTLD